MKPEMPVDPLSSAVEHADLGLRQSVVARFPLPKRMVERLVRFFTAPQRAYNLGVVDAIRLLRDADQQLGHRMTIQAEDQERVTAGLRSDLTQLELALTDGQTTASLTSGQVVELARALQRLESRIEQLDATVADVLSEERTKREQHRDQE